MVLRHAIVIVGDFFKDLPLYFRVHFGICSIFIIMGFHKRYFCPQGHFIIWKPSRMSCSSFFHPLSYCRVFRSSFFHSLSYCRVFRMKDNSWMVSILYCQSVIWSSTPQAPLTPSNWSALYRGRGSPVISWILLKANNGQQASGVGDKRFLRFKRNAYHLWTAIIRHRLNDITHQQVVRFNQGSNFANMFKVHLKHPQCFGTLAQPSHFLLNTPVMTQRIFTVPARVRVRKSKKTLFKVGQSETM